MWRRDYLADSNIVEQQIRVLRKKLGDNFHEPRYIQTVPRKGYRFIAYGH